MSPMHDPPARAAAARRVLGDVAVRRQAHDVGAARQVFRHREIARGQAHQPAAEPVGPDVPDVEATEALG
jgi:hypothetical protein